MYYIDIALWQTPQKTYDQYKFLVKFDRWTECLGNMTQFLFQITILGFCWVYATRPRPQVGKIEDADIEDDEIKVEET